MIKNLHYARGIAAILVVYSHAHGLIRKRHEELVLTDHFWMVEQGYSKLGGGLGVDLLLLLSGFILFYTYWDKPCSQKTFLTKRCVRIFPTWWVAVSGIVILSLVPGVSASYSWNDIATSYLLFPVSEHGDLRPPVLEVGWALHFIVLFYLIFACLLPLSTPIALRIITVFFMSTTLLGYVVKFDSGVWMVLSNPRMLTYVIGGWLACAYKHERLIWSNYWRYGLIAFILIWAYMFIAFPQWRVEYSPFYTRVPMVSAIFMLLLFDPRLQAKQCSKHVALLGNASYSVYLFHMFPFIVLSGLWKRGILCPDGLSGWVIWPALIVMGVTCGLIAYQFIERPLTRKFKRSAIPIQCPT